MTSAARKAPTSKASAAKKRTSTSVRKRAAKSTAKKPAKKPTTRRALKPVAKRPTTRRPAAKAAAKKPVPAPVAKKPVATKPVAKTPVAKKPLPTKPAPQTAVFRSRVTAHPYPVKDSAGQVWGAIPANWGTRRISTTFKGKDFAGTSDDVLYQANAWDAKGYDVAVPAAATYRVTMHFADDKATSGGQRVFDVRAEGRTVVRDLDVFRAVGQGAAHRVTFDVRVTDGFLNLDYVKRADLPLVSAIEVQSTVPVALPRPAPRLITFAPGNPYTTRIDKAPLAANSDRLAAALAGQVRNFWGGVAATNAYGFNVAFNVAPKGTPRIRVGFHDCQNKRSVPSGLYDGPGHFVDVPVPRGAVAANGSDGQMTVYDPAADQVWDFWQMRRNAGTGRWEACWGGRLDNVSKTIRPVYPAPYGASASGLVIAGGVITADDVRRNEINHAMNLGIIDVSRWDTHSWPANRSDGTQPPGTAIMEGQRLRLDPTLDLTRYNLTPFGRLVAEAAQRYGFIVTDRSGAVGVATESGAPEKARTGVNPWPVLLGGEAYDALKGFPWDRVQVLPPDYGRPRG